jgi:hypothetical protein
MPGYSGLEVCEKVRASIETLKTPVLLTVGKMEPYKSEDASRVRADGVIIKPFEASDLLAIVKKLEERIVPKATPMAEQTILLDRPPDFSQFTQERDTFQIDPPHPEESSTAQPMISVPDDMASSAAFGDMLGMGLDDESTPAAVAQPSVPPPPPVRPPVRQIDAPMSGEFDSAVIDSPPMAKRRSCRKWKCRLHPLKRPVSRSKKHLLNRRPSRCRWKCRLKFIRWPQSRS